MKENTFYKKMDDIRKGAINATAAVLAAPATMRANSEMRQSDEDLRLLKEERASKGAPNYNPDGSVTRAFKTRSLAGDVKERLTMKGMPKEKQAFLKNAVKKGKARFVSDCASYIQSCMKNPRSTCRSRYLLVSPEMGASIEQ